MKWQHAATLKRVTRSHVHGNVENRKPIMHIFRDFESWLINSRHIRTRLCPQCCFSVLRQMQNVSPLCASLLFHHNSLLFMENIIFHECSSTSLRLSPKRTTTCHSCTPLKPGKLVNISLKAVVNSGQ